MFPSQTVLDLARKNTNELVTSSINLKKKYFISEQMPNDECTFYIYSNLNSL